jgi:hypothetical protein
MTDQVEGKELFQGSPAAGTDKPGAEKKAGEASTGGDNTQGSLALLVGEGRKYKTVEDLAKGYINADEHVETLKGDNLKLREEAVKGKTLSDVFERIEQNRKAAGDTTSVTAKAITAADIAKLVDERITGRETAKTREDNLRKAEAALTVKYGDKAKEVYLARGDTPEKRKALNDLAAVDPSSFEALFTTQAIVGNPADGSTKGGDRIVTDTPTGRALDPDCKEFYDVMRRKTPQKYYSQVVQLEMHKKLAANTAKFLGRKVG